MYKIIAIFLLITFCSAQSIGWCKPPSGYMYDNCTECVACSKDCPGGQQCLQDVNCGGSWSVYCSAKPSPTPSQNCYPNQFWNGTACEAQKGWCQPVGAWIYDTCSECVACPETGPCPGEQQCVKSINCLNWSTLCSASSEK